MTCDHLREHFDPSDVATADVAQHLARCPDCRAYADELRQLSALLAEWGFDRVPVPEDFESRLRRRLAERSARSSGRRVLALMPRLAMAAAVVVAIAIGIRSFRTSQAPSLLSPPSPVSESVSSDHPREVGTSAPPLLAAVPPKPTPAPPSEDVARSPRVRPRRMTGESLATALTIPKPTSAGVVLLIRDEQTDEESIVPIPPVVFGSRPLFPLRATPWPLAGEKRGVL
jgi:hypothetical protein